jgi:Spy/CpxP family protein refolding chaperone
MQFHVPFMLSLVVLAAQHVHPQSAPGDTLATSALTADAVRQLLDGEGMGLARPAEMNNYPGPKHLLERAQELTLTTEQQKEISAIRQQVVNRAKPLGRAIIDAERELDVAFRSGTLSEADLKKQLDAIARLQADLRMVHLRAHLITKPILTPEQVRKYYERR